MTIEQPKQESPEEIAKLEKSRAIAEGRLLEGGAEYILDSDGQRILNPTVEQRDAMSQEMAEDQKKKEKNPLKKNLDEETLKTFESFFDKTPQGLEGDGIGNRMLILGLQIKLAKNLLTAIELEKFDQIIQQIGDMSWDVNEREMPSSYNTPHVTCAYKDIQIPKFDDYKKRAKFLNKLLSLGFNLQKNDDRPDGHPSILIEYNEWFLRIDCVTQYDDDAYHKGKES